MRASSPLITCLTPQQAGTCNVCVILEGKASGLIVCDARGRFLDTVPEEVLHTTAYQRAATCWHSLQACQQRWCMRLDRLLSEGRTFTPAQMLQAGQHPILADLICQLVWVDANGNEGLLRGDMLDNPRGSVRYDGPLRLVHPIEWLDAGTLVKWQYYANAHNLRQPVAQIFRRLCFPDAPGGKGVLHSNVTGRALTGIPAIATLHRLRWRGPLYGQSLTTFTRYFPQGWAAHLTFTVTREEFFRTQPLPMPILTFSHHGRTALKEKPSAILYSEVQIDRERLIVLDTNAY